MRTAQSIISPRTLRIKVSLRHTFKALKYLQRNHEGRNVLEQKTFCSGIIKRFRGSFILDILISVCQAGRQYATPCGRGKPAELGRLPCSGDYQSVPSIPLVSLLQIVALIILFTHDVRAVELFVSLIWCGNFFFLYCMSFSSFAIAAITTTCTRSVPIYFHHNDKAAIDT